MSWVTCTSGLIAVAGIATMHARMGVWFDIGGFLTGLIGCYVMATSAWRERSKPL